MFWILRRIWLSSKSSNSSERRFLKRYHLVGTLCESTSDMRKPIVGEHYPRKAHPMSVKPPSLSGVQKTKKVMWGKIMRPGYHASWALMMLAGARRAQESP